MKPSFGPLCGVFALAALGLAACATPEAEAPAPEAPAVERPVLSTRADSIAMRIVDASGGLEAWASAPYLRFDFASFRDSVRTVRARHLWNRRTGDYRVEMPTGPDTTYVVLLNVNTFDMEAPEGAAYLNGQPADTSRRADLLKGAYGRFINDTYWLLVPLKVFDPGVHRADVPDSSTADQDVITLTFDDVGLTPGDQYWLYADRATGRLARWAYRLRHFEATTPTTFHDWVDYTPMEAPAGTVSLATRKVGRGGGATLTDNLSLPPDVPAELFTDPNPRLESFGF
jgi:hypothetical protein